MLLGRQSKTADPREVPALSRGQFGPRKFDRAGGSCRELRFASKIEKAGSAILECRGQPEKGPG